MASGTSEPSGLRGCQRSVQKQIVEKLDEAASDPFVVAKKVVGVNLNSIRSGDYRIIISIEKQKMVILVIEVGHRSKIYGKL